MDFGTRAGAEADAAVFFMYGRADMGVCKTMLQTLYARAQESKKSDHHIYDERAIEVVSDRKDGDFTNLPLYLARKTKDLL